ncbi:uncharacterized protein LOC117893639 [Drosophila subobscura]|uniref:uncharacterized protein LOC117893639 n=1 Tax=Drosophila subobscura TaxID=7241 RepID=UPI00155B15B3|nr:uncharacterized protein LOC117893639 [Drosophila subobscura]
MRGKLRRSSDEPTVINAHKNACASAIKNASATLVASKCDDSMPPLPPASIECNMESPVPRRLPDSVISDMEVGGKQAEQADEEEEEVEVELRATPARSRARARVRVSLSAASAQSGGSSESEPTTSTQTSSTVTSTVTRAVTKRKYSFKTHAGRSYVQHHTPRRISSSCSNSGGGGAGMGQATDVPTGSSSSTNSLVAKLTQQFNEIIQKDARVLEQVKRKKGVWLARGSHVYKIVEKQPAAMQPPPENGISTVQRNIKKFETLEKPSVPQKSEQLRHLAAATGTARSNNLTLKTKRSLKGSPAELEVVCEEAKTPVELEPATEEKATKEEPPAAEQQQQPPMETEEDDLKPELELDEERQKQRKHKYASIYEKLRFTFAGRSRKSASPSPTKAAAPEMALQMVTEMAPEEMETKLEEEPQQTGANSPLMLGQCIEADADSKILDALEVLDQKIKGISAHSEAGELLLGTNDDFEQRLLPNTSFVYQAANKQISNNQLLVNQAVNVTLVNAIEGEQMIMEQKQLLKAENEKKNEEQQEEQVAVREEPKELPAEEEPESIYEPITPSALPAIEPKTEAHASSLFKIVDIQKSEIVEDIYQTVEEASASAAAACAKPNIWLEGYESIAGSCEATPPDFDGYESFAPPTPTANLEECLPMSTPSPGTHGGTLGRNTRDELPELPKPKRVLPKSPALLRPAPPKPDLAKDEDEDENIYDTIKGCYESMHTKVPASSGSGSGTTTTDAISLGSNCYESISHYRKTKTTATATATGHGTCIQLSSSGSTLTICSDHKTNSLYESSLAAAGCVMYGSASVGCRSSLGSGGSASSSGGGGKRAGDKRSSIAGSSDNSDAWVDISDGEGATAATAERLEAGPPPTEAQFVVVRERFKPHRTRSPDWSKRIRDKRLQQKKAISCIEVLTEWNSFHYPNGNVSLFIISTYKRFSSA